MRRPARMSDGILWFGVAALAVVAEAAAFVDSIGGFEFNWIGFTLSTTLLAICGIGITLRWGPMLPSTFIGMLIAVFLLGPSTSSSPMESVRQEFVPPIAGAILGALFGVYWESAREHASGSLFDRF